MDNDIIELIENDMHSIASKIMVDYIDIIVKRIQALLPNGFGVDILDDIGYVITHDTDRLYIRNTVHNPVSRVEDFLENLYNSHYGEEIFRLLPDSIYKDSVTGDNSQHIKSKYTPFEQSLLAKIATLETQNGRLHYALSKARELLGEFNSGVSNNHIRDKYNEKIPYSVCGEH